MLYVTFGRHTAPEGYILDTRIYFSRHKQAWWFEDDFVKRFLLEIDKCKVLFQEALLDRAGRGISTEMMSTGCKTLCDIYYDENETCFYGSAMGDNCVPFLIEIARDKDVYIFLEHYMDIPEKYFNEGIIAEMYTKKVLGEYDFDDLFSDWAEWTASLDPMTLQPTNKEED